MDFAQEMRDIRGCANGVCLRMLLYTIRRQEENGHACWACTTAVGIGVNARAPANSQCESDKREKKIGFRSCSAPPACPHLRAKQVAPIGMEEFQIFYEIKSRRSVPFVRPDIVMRAVCEDPLACRGRLNWTTVYLRSRKDIQYCYFRARGVALLYADY
jgi:hypothetical protein